MNLIEGPVLFLGIGGSGMSSLAHMMLDLNIPTYGYDQKKSETTEFLKSRGAVIFHSIEEYSKYPINLVVYSSAINDKYKEVFSTIQNSKIQMLHRSDCMHKLIQSELSISVAGSHGKTSTTTMIAQVLEETDKNPSIMIGGDTELLGKKGGKIGDGKFSVYESDESDGTFLKHKAEIRVITNIDNDHLDHYKTLESLEESFIKYLSCDTPGHAVVCGEDSGVRNILNKISNRNEFHSDFHLWITLEQSNPNLSIWKNLLGKKMGDNLHLVLYEDTDETFIFKTETGETQIVKLPFPGWHYRSNAFLALVTTNLCGITYPTSNSILSRYVGVKRRQEYLGTKNEVRVLDDYGHHPTEIEMVIQSLSISLKNKGRLFVIFQPHRYTRTQLLLLELAKSLSKADELFLLPIYSAGETPIPGISEKSFLPFLKETNVHLLSGNVSDDVNTIQKLIQKNDTLLCLGAGNVRDWGMEFLNH